MVAIKLRRARGWIAVVIVMALLGLNFAFTSAYENHTQDTQRQQGIVIEQRLCHTLRRLAALQPPPGNPGTNPSRAYDQQLHATLAELGPDLGCGRITR